MRLARCAALLALLPGALSGQSVLDRSPNIQGVWGLNSGRAVFVLSHRFEFIDGVDQLFSVPTLTLAVGLPLRLTLGLDYTSFSEAIPGRQTENEAEFWLKRPFRLGSSEAALLGGYNTAAGSADAAVDVRYVAGRLQLFGEGRAYSDLFGSDEPGASGTIGAAVRLTEHLAVTGDLGRVFTQDTVPAAWSAALALEIPGSPHTLSLQVTNTGATTLQGASREKALGGGGVRYGFTFTVPLGGGGTFARIFRPFGAAPQPSDPSVAAAVQMRQLDFGPGEVRIRPGESVEWINQDPVAHTVTATDESWDSGYLEDGERYIRTFTEPGRYDYFCIPHPAMRGTIVVEEGDREQGTGNSLQLRRK